MFKELFTNPPKSDRLFDAESLKQMYDAHLKSFTSDISWMEPDEIKERLSYAKKLEKEYDEKYQRAKQYENSIRNKYIFSYIGQKSKIVQFLKYNPIYLFLIYLFSNLIIFGIYLMILILSQTM